MRFTVTTAGVCFVLASVASAQSVAPRTRSYARSVSSYAIFDAQGTTDDSHWSASSTAATASSYYNTSMGRIENRTDFFADYSGLRGIVKNSMNKVGNISYDNGLQHMAQGYGGIEYAYGSISAVGATVEDVFTAGAQGATLSFKVTLHSVASHDSTAKRNDQMAALDFTAYAAEYGTTSPYRTNLSLASYYLATGEEIITKTATVTIGAHKSLNIFLGLGLGDNLILNHNSATGSYSSELNAMSTGKLGVTILSGSFNSASGYRYGATTTPEPATMSLLGLACWTAFRKRQR